MRLRLVAVASFGVVASCSLVYPFEYTGADGGARDVAVTDAPPDAPADAALDAPDAALDAALDDGAPDATLDAPDVALDDGAPDAALDVPDVARDDAARDALADAMPEVFVDAALDAPDASLDAPDASLDVAADRADAAVDAPADRADVTVDAPVDAAPDRVDGAVDAAPDVLTCRMGLRRCGAECVDTQSDAANCGACGVRCAVACYEGACIQAVDVRVGHGDDTAVHACARMSDRTVWCWGANGSGQLGDGTTFNRWRPVPVVGLRNVAEIAVGSGHTCARIGDGTVQCWGSGTYGQLGDGTARRLTPTVVPGLSGVTSLSAGGGSGAQGHTCAVVADGLVSCWGRNTFGQAGSATVDMLTSPAIVSGTRGFERVSAGGFHTCGVRSDGSTRCWGMGIGGQLGDGLNTTTSTPVAAEGFLATAVSAGSESTCGLATDGRMWCWGYDRHGVLGRGVAGTSSTPAVLALTSATAVSVGSYHACAIVTRAPLQCWGYNNEGQIGDQGGLLQRATPGPVSAVVGATAVSCGYQSTCAVVADGNVLCFGRNAQGQLGDGTTTPSRSPVTVRF